MLNTKVGNCYGFASTLAAFAKELGYKKIELIDGRTPGTRDHAPDGFTGLRFSKDPANVARQELLGFAGNWL